MSDLEIWRTDLRGGHKLYNSAKNAGWDPELDTCVQVFERRKLRDLFMKRVADLGGEIMWNMKAKEVKTLPHGRSQVAFENGEIADLDLFVGADGAWSPIRKFILQQRTGSAAGEQRWPAKFTGGKQIPGPVSSM